MISREELRGLFLFESLSDDQLDWLAARGEVRTYDAGAEITREGEPATHMYVLLEGRLRLLRRVGTDDLTINETSHPGAYGGAVRAYLEKEERYASSMTAVAPCRFFRLGARDLDQFVRTQFPMALHLLEGLYAGIRTSESQVRQREHLAALGALSANLAHELNNPAAATVRAASQLRARIADLRTPPAAGHLPADALAGLLQVQQKAVERASGTRVDLTPLQLTDREDEIADRLDELGVDGAYDLAAVYAAAGLDAAWVDEVLNQVDGDLRAVALTWLASALETEALLDELEDASNRISTLVDAVKLYSHMDAATHDQVDLHVGLDSTVVILGAKLSGIRIVRDYDSALPPVPVYAAEMNQVWTNLLDNAAYALDGRGTITLRTRREGEGEDGWAVVELSDDGPGIPPEAVPRIFDAFFTTKPPGQGTGLGLDNAHRIVTRRHDGTIEVDTSPAGTTFRVRLPLRSSRT